jgi:hypothetical protein
MYKAIFQLVLIFKTTMERLSIKVRLYYMVDRSRSTSTGTLKLRPDTVTAVDRRFESMLSSQCGRPQSTGLENRIKSIRSKWFWSIQVDCKLRFCMWTCQSTPIDDSGGQHLNSLDEFVDRCEKNTKDNMDGVTFIRIRISGFSGDVSNIVSDVAKMECWTFCPECWAKLLVFLKANHL